MFELFVLFGVGALSSFVGGLMGLGGGFILIPLLTLQVQFGIKTAIFFSLINMFWMSLLKMFQHSEMIRVHRDLVRELGIFSISGAVVAAYVGSRTNDLLLNLLLAAILISIGFYFFKDRHNQYENDEKPLPKWWAKVGFSFSGVLGGLLGLGGGILNVPILHRVLRFNLADAAKVNFPFIFLTSAFALIVTFHQRREEIIQISPIAIIVLLLGTSMGSSMSGKVKISSKNLKSIFAALLILMGLLKIYKIYPLLIS